MLPAGLRRHGYNRFDFTGADPIWAGFWSDYDILFADFDNGLAGPGRLVPPDGLLHGLERCLL